MGPLKNKWPQNFLKKFIGNTIWYNKKSYLCGGFKLITFQLSNMKFVIAEVSLKNPTENAPAVFQSALQRTEGLVAAVLSLPLKWWDGKLTKNVLENMKLFEVGSTNTQPNEKGRWTCYYVTRIQ